jgi:hypothetical protein
LYELARMGDIQEILTKIAEVEAANSAYKAFADEIRQAAGEFDTRRIKKYLQACLKIV